MADKDSEEKEKGSEKKKNYFMAQETIDDSLWTKDKDKVPIRKTLIKTIAACNFRYYQNLLNFIVSWCTVIAYIYFTANM